MAVVKRLLAVMLLILIVLWVVVLTFKGKSVLMEDEDAASYYRAFLQNTTSGVVTKYTYGKDNWMDIISTRREKLCFATDTYHETGNRTFTYSVLNPFVFFYFPAADYCNGTNYYYRHNGRWFTDNSSNAEDYLNNSYYGIPPEILDENIITKNFVYKNENGSYSIEIVSDDKKNNLKYTVTGELDKNKNFKKIVILTQNTNNNIKIGDKYSAIYYSRINKNVTIKPPKDLFAGRESRNDGDIVYRLHGLN